MQTLFTAFCTICFQPIHLTVSKSDISNRYPVIDQLKKNNLREFAKKYLVNILTMSANSSPDNPVKLKLNF